MDATTDWARRVTRPPADEVARLREVGVLGRRTIADELRAVADAFPDREAVVTPDARLRYRELDRAADRVAVGLMDRGLRPGQTVLLQVGNRIEVVVAWYGLLKAGLVPVCTLAAHRAHEIGAISRRTGAVAHLVEAGGSADLVAFARGQAVDHPTLRHLLTVGATGDTPGARVEDLGADVDAAEARARVDRVQATINPDDVAVLQLSGGTTGVPKVIPRMHAEYWFNARAYAAGWGWDATTRNGHMIPLVHNAGIVCGLHGPHSVGGCLLLTPADLDVALPVLAAEGVTDLLVGHGHYRAVPRDDFAALAPTLRTVVLSGAKVPDALFERLEQLGVWSGQLFGMGEGFFAITHRDAPREARLRTVGSPLCPDDEYRVLHPGTEEEVPPGEVGELVCRGPYTLRGYLDAPEHNARAFTHDGFLRTGDLVAERTIDGRTYLGVEGRIKDVINRGGEKVNAEEVELVLLRHPAVAAAAVVAMPDERLGERTCAFLVATDAPVGLPDVRHHLAEIGLAKFKWPERLEWVDRLPTTAVGKLDKKRLAAEIAARVAAERPPAAEPHAGLTAPAVGPA
ncbi:(2,3-dihydroxybenzoyl)adenylate synthase [Nocardioides sp. CPCC 205120]|uniref:(2,3-dihydroxybenzoyl)adenylate synthase n=1 Tax=Nocardioides sp. CPCC 205120 TaxID=3406462 RepID=UPI003B4FFFFC